MKEDLKVVLVGRNQEELICIQIIQLCFLYSF